MIINLVSRNKKSRKGVDVKRARYGEEKEADCCFIL
jgi:hypothetical protein